MPKKIDRKVGKKEDHDCVVVVVRLLKPRFQKRPALWKGKGFFLFVVLENLFWRPPHVQVVLKVPRFIGVRERGLDFFG